MPKEMEDLTGRTYGKLSVIRFSHKDKRNSSFWFVKCSCGKEKIINGSSMKNGHTKGCGCLNKEKKLKPIPKICYEMIGKTFNFLTPLEIRVHDFDKNSKSRFFLNCKCVCGKEREIIYTQVLNGTLMSCGCKRSNGKLRKGESGLREVYKRYKNNASQRDLDFNLSIEEFETLTQKKCHYCGCEPKSSISKKRRNGVFFYNGIDRVNNLLGYSKENCVTCCSECNFRKLDYELPKFLRWVSDVYNNSINPLYKEETQIDTSDIFIDKERKEEINNKENI